MKEWFIAKELAGLPGLPSSERGMLKWLQANLSRGRKRAGSKAKEYPISCLPAQAQAALLSKAHTIIQPTKQQCDDDLEALWDRYERVPESMKEKAKRSVQIVTVWEDLLHNGVPATLARAQIEEQFGIDKSSMYRLYNRVKGQPRSEWLALLVPRHNGRTREAEITPEAWEFFKADYLRLEAPSIAACYERLMRAAAENGWEVPAKRTIELWATKKIPANVRVLRRQGELALMKRFPAIERSVRDMHAMQWINGDGYQHNVFVRWTDGEIVRLKTWFWQDVYSRKILSYRVDLTENTDSIRLAFGDLVEQYGVPAHVTIDNTRAAANKWMTGGVPNRYRFKVKEDDPMGIFTQLGIQVHWTSVDQAGTQAKGRGQAKPLERGFGVGGLGEYVDKHPDFAGAYTGPNTNAKPENYSQTAVPLETFLRVLNEEVIAWNAKAGRRTEMGAGVHSFDHVFNESYARAPITKATERQRRLWLLTAEAITVARDGTFTLAAGAKTGMGRDGRNRYYSPALQEYGEHRQKIVIRFDPESLHEHVFAYTLDGRFIDDAQCIEALGFGDTDAGRIWNKTRRAYVKATKAVADAEIKMELAEVGRRLPRPELPDPAESKVVRPARTASRIELPQQDRALIEQADKELLTSNTPEPKVAYLSEFQEGEQRFNRWCALALQAKNQSTMGTEDAAFLESYITTDIWRGYTETYLLCNSGAGGLDKAELAQWWRKSELLKGTLKKGQL